jgi:hypothetical protein
MIAQAAIELIAFVSLTSHNNAGFALEIQAAFVVLVQQLHLAAAGHASSGFAEGFADALVLGAVEPDGRALTQKLACMLILCCDLSH